MQIRWNVDAVTLVFVLFVVALARSLPPPFAALLLFSELAFVFVLAPLKVRHLAHDAAAVTERASAVGSPSPYAKVYRLREGIHVLRRLLDPAEAHADLLRDPAWFQGWWSGVETVESLRLGNVAEFLSYTLYGTKRGVAVCESSARLLHQASLRFVGALGLDIGSSSFSANDDGSGSGSSSPDLHHNPNASFIAHTEEPLKVAYRPLIFYAVTELIGLFGHFQLTFRNGFVAAGETDIATYYVSSPADDATIDHSLPPLVFLHGIGLGLAPYTAFLAKLKAQHPGRTLVAAQYKHVSMRLSAKSAPTASEVADDVAAFLAGKGISQANVIGHSYGTLVSSSLAKKHPKLIAGLTLIDPVCFAMFLPHLVSNTLHFDVKKGGLVAFNTAAAAAAAPRLSLMSRWRRLQPKALMKGLVLRELHCATAMTRRFNWADMNLWTSEIPPNTTVILGGNDNMIPAAEIHAMLTSPAAVARGVSVVHNAELGHGAFLLHPDVQDTIAAAASLLPVPLTAPSAPSVLNAAASVSSNNIVALDNSLLASLALRAAAATFDEAQSVQLASFCLHPSIQSMSAFNFLAKPKPTSAILAGEGRPTVACRISRPPCRGGGLVGRRGGGIPGATTSVLGCRGSSASICSAFPRLKALSSLARLASNVSPCRHLPCRGGDRLPLPCRL